MYTGVSSAHEWPVSWNEAMISNTSAAYYRNSRGAMTDPCGTPYSSSKTEDRQPLKQTRWALSDRNDRIHARTAPPRPNLDCSLDSRISWSTQSKATLRSKRACRVTFLSSAAISVSDSTPLFQFAAFATNKTTGRVDQVGWLWLYIRYRDGIPARRRSSVPVLIGPYFIDCFEVLIVNVP